VNNETAALIRDIMPGLGLGIFLAIVLVVGFVALGAFRSRFSGYLIALIVYAVFACVCLAMWAQHLVFKPNPEALKYLGYIIGAVSLALVLEAIVKRAPPGVLLAISSIVVGGGMVGSVVLFAPYKNFVLLVAIVAILALVIIIAMSMLLIDRRHAREVQHPRINNYYGQTPDMTYLPRREEQRGQLAAPSQKTNLPAVVRDDKTGRWLT
jgi:hypothetical protein